jgi:hypothetical protein
LQKTVSKGGKISKLIKVGAAVAVVAGLVSLTGSLFRMVGQKNEGSKFANNVPL